MKMIKFGDLIEECHSGILVHGCNSQGIMNSGIASDVRKKYPECYASYKAHCAKDISTNVCGTVDLYVVNDTPQNYFIIANAITQEFFGRDSQRRYVSYQSLHSCFTTIAALANELETSVNYPLIGAGLANGDWAIISDIIESCFAPYPSVQHTLWIKEIYSTRITI